MSCRPPSSFIVKELKVFPKGWGDGLALNRDDFAQSFPIARDPRQHYIEDDRSVEQPMLDVCAHDFEESHQCDLFMHAQIGAAHQLDARSEFRIGETGRQLVGDETLRGVELRADRVSESPLLLRAASLGGDGRAVES